MNQILSMDPGMGMNMNMGEPKRGGAMEVNSVVKIFAIVVIIFGLAMVGLGTFNLIDSLSGKNKVVDTWPKFDPYQDGNTLNLTVSNDQIIESVTYHWNNGFEKVVQGDQTKNLVVTIDVPAGDNILNLKVTDINGKETQYQQSFTGTETEDTVEPSIELSILGSKLNIVAKTTTETPLAYITYKWNNDQETRVDVSNDNTMIEAQTTISKGENTITITAVKENGVSATQTKKFIGAVKPTIDVNQDGTTLNVKIVHESGVKSANITLNGKKVVLTDDRFGEDQKTVEFTLTLKTGQENTVVIEATSIDGTTETFNGVAQV